MQCCPLVFDQSPSFIALGDALEWTLHREGVYGVCRINGTYPGSEPDVGGAVSNA